MKNFLFPQKFRLIGWILFIPATIMGVLTFFDILHLSGIIETVVDDAAIIGMILGALFIVCSKQKNEDEMTRSIRLAALLKSLYVYVALLIISTLLINGIAYLWVMTVNLVLFPLIYVITFRIELHHYEKMSEDEE